MKLRLAIAAALACAAGSNAMAYDLLNDWPVKYKTDTGYEYGFKGLYQYDLNRFSGDTTHPLTGADLFPDANAWRRKEFNFYGKTPWGLDFQVGYDFTFAGGVSAGWIDNFVRYTSPSAGAFRIGQFKTPVGWDEAGTSSSATTFMERALPVQAAAAGRRIGVDWQDHPQLARCRGYDHCFLLDPLPGQPAVTLISGDRRLHMKMYTDQPGVQLYTGNWLAGTPARGGGEWQNYQGLCLEAQQLPDSPNRPELGDPWLLPGQTYRHQTRYRLIPTDK